MIYVAKIAIQTPLTELIIEASKFGLTRVRFVPTSQNTNESTYSGQKKMQSLSESVVKSKKKAIGESVVARAHLTTAEQWFNAYFEGRDETLPQLDYTAFSSFSKKISIQLLRSTHFGKTMSYGELARLAGHPNAGRAVGTIMRKNPWPIIIPCHRVLLSNGNLGRYSAGRGELSKRWLLQHESTHRPDFD